MEGLEEKDIEKMVNSWRSEVLEAEKLTVDKDDAPVIALALSIDNEVIWTFNTKHFRQKIFGDRIKVLTSKDLIKLVSFD